MLHLLPLEVVSEILLYLDVTDIENVLSVDEFKNALQDKFLLVVDDVYNYRRFPSIKNRYKWEDIHTRSLELKGMLCIIVVTKASDYLSPTKLLEGCGLVKYYYISKPEDPKITITPCSLEKMDLSKNSFFFSELEELFVDNIELISPMLQFPDLIYLTLENTTFLPKNLNFPKLEGLSLISCESRDTSSRWDLPLLDTLLVREKFKTINDSVDYMRTTMTNLTLQEIADMESWSNISSSSLLYINAVFSTQIQQIRLENLNFFSLEVFWSSANSFKLHQLWIPRVRSFGLQAEFDNEEGDEISYFDAPDLTVLQLENLQLRTLDHIYTPALVSLDTRYVKTVGNHNCDHTFLEGTTTMNVISSDWWKYTDNLELFTIEDVTLLHELDGHYFPHLSNLIISPTIANMDTTPLRLPVLNAPYLEKVEFLSIPNLFDFSGLNHYGNSLESLYLFQSDDIGEIVLKDLYLPSLLVFSGECDTPERFIIQRCNFPELIELELRGCGALSAQTPHVQLSSLELPKLKFLSLTQILLSPTLDLSKYPLKQIRLYRCEGLKTIILPHGVTIDVFEIVPHPAIETEIITIYHDRTFDPSKYRNLDGRVDLTFIEVAPRKETKY